LSASSTPLKPVIDEKTGNSIIHLSLSLSLSLSMICYLPQIDHRSMRATTRPVKFVRELAQLPNDTEQVHILSPNNHYNNIINNNNNNNNNNYNVNLHLHVVGWQYRIRQQSLHQSRIA
jgi:AAA+ ATPase superfamily predicted ATPase